MANEDICRPGFVWQEALPGDRVCVTPATRARAAADDRGAAARRVGSAGKRVVMFDDD